jgi:hypothetical protein
MMGMDPSEYGMQVIAKAIERIMKNYVSFLIKFHWVYALTRLPPASSGRQGQADRANPLSISCSFKLYA